MHLPCMEYASMATGLVLCEPTFGYSAKNHDFQKAQFFFVLFLIESWLWSPATRFGVVCNLNFIASGSGFEKQHRRAPESKITFSKDQLNTSGKVSLGFGMVLPCWTISVGPMPATPWASRGILFPAILRATSE
ncbi:hypothetical protein H1C71_039964 [Ictidomys tridecemlineatus]|nr:hypothetical protein H1C71_039964 [Ictidomys tridecemlineatus]KAG3256807.1 hypothetical protein H1C71_039964 [Ictidomys tridecemlineatus]